VIDIDKKELEDYKKLYNSTFAVNPENLEACYGHRVILKVLQHSLEVVCASTKKFYNNSIIPGFIIKVTNKLSTFDPQIT